MLLLILAALYGLCFMLPLALSIPAGFVIAAATVLTVLAWIERAGEKRKQALAEYAAWCRNDRWTPRGTVGPDGRYER